jgi:beta-lactamase class A
LPADFAASFEQLSSTLPGDIELAVAPLGEGSTKVLGANVPAHGWSTTKVPVLVALLKARGAGGLTAQENLLAHPAITESNNDRSSPYSEISSRSRAVRPDRVETERGREVLPRSG